MMSKRTVFFLSVLWVLVSLFPLSIPAEEGQQDNPFFQDWSTPFQAPPFDKIKNNHFLSAIREGIARQQAEVDAITASADAPTFANTLAALDASGKFLAKVNSVFFSLQGAETNPELQALAREAAPLLAAHNDNINLNEKLFVRVKAVYDSRQDLALDTEEKFLLESGYRDFIRSGALLGPENKEKLRAINQQLSLAGLKFGENLLAETNSSRIVIENPDNLAGLPEAVRAMAADTGAQQGLAGKWVFTAQTPSWTPFLQYSQKRGLRQQLRLATIMRGDRDNANDNKEVIKQIVARRLERAKLLGYASHADFVLAENMAKTPEAVDAFLKRLWEPALARATAEAADMQAIIDREKGGFALESWDWWYYAEKVRQEKYAFDDTAIRPYFQLENVKKGIFTLCDKIYGLQFTELKNIPVYHPEVQVYEVKEADGRHVGVLYLDFFPRPGKRAGAWSGRLRGEYYENGKRVAPLSTIVCNFTRPTADTPSLLNIDEVTTFFHEFGHALNSLLSDARYRSRDIPRDCIELPSQIMENWALEPELLALYARHWQTNEPIPATLVVKLKQSSLFNQGFETVEYLAASILDMAWHKLNAVGEIDVRRFDADCMAAIGLIPAIVPRYRSTYFNHIFGGAGGYSAGYYSYIWAGVLDKDAFEAFKEKGLFDRATATAFRRNVLEKLGTEDAMTLYKRFRGAEPRIEPLLRSRGLLPDQK